MVNHSDLRQISFNIWIGSASTISSYSGIYKEICLQYKEARM